MAFNWSSVGAGDMRPKVVLDNFVLCGNVWHWEIMGAKFDRIAKNDGTRFLGENVVTAVVLEGRAHVESILGTEVPRTAEEWFVMYLDTAPHRA